MRRKWKWGVVAVLVVVAAILWRWPVPSAKIELLPFTDSPPAWDGSYPYVVLSRDSRSAPSTYKGSVAFVVPSARHDSAADEFDVDLHTGRFILRQTDLFVQDVMPLALTRTYIIWDNHSRAFGVGGNHPYDIAPTGSRFPYTYMYLNLEDWYQVYMPRVSKGTGYADATFRHTETSSEFYGAMTAWNGNGWTLTFRDGRKVVFPDSYQAKTYAQGAPTEIEDGQGHRLVLKRGPTRNLKELDSPSGHLITFQYDSSDRVVEADDDAGHVRKYSYDGGGHVDTVSDGAHVLYRFEYQRLMMDAGYDPWLLTAVMDGDWKLLLRNKYLWGRVSEQKLADGETYRYEYALRGRDVMQTIVTPPSGEKKTFAFRDGMVIWQK